MFTESKIIKQIAIIPASNAINLQWANQVKKNDEVISETFERKAYEVEALDGYTSNGVTIDLNAFLTAFNAATLDEKAAAVAAKATAEAALATATADKASAISALEAAHATALTAKDNDKAQALSAKDAEIAALQAQVQALTPAPVTDPMIDDLQIRLALNRTGLRDAVEAAVAAGDQDLKDWWLKARRFFRSNPMVIAMGETVGVTPEQLDNLWALGATL